MSLTTDEIIAKFGEIYPTVEGAMTANNALYKEGLADIERLYDDWNITGTDKAKYVANYIGASTAQMINAAMQVSMSLVEKAYVLPIEAEHKQAQIMLLNNEQKQVLQKEITYKEAQTMVLKNSENLNALIKAFQAVTDMMGSMGSGGIVAPVSLIAASREALFKTLEILKNVNGTTLFSAAEMQKLKDAVTTDNDKMTETNNINKKVN